MKPFSLYYLVFIILYIKKTYKRKMMKLFIALLLTGAVLGLEQNLGDIWNTTYRIEEAIRGATYGYIVSFHYPSAGQCVRELGRVGVIIGMIREMIDKKEYNLQRIVAIITNIAEFVFAEMYSCQELSLFWAEQEKYFNEIALNPAGYVINVILNIVGNIPYIISKINHATNFFSKNDYFYGADAIGTCVHDVFFKNVK